MGLTNLEAWTSSSRSTARNYQAIGKALRRIPGLGLLEFDETERNNLPVRGAGRRSGLSVSARPRSSRSCMPRTFWHGKYFWPGCHNMQPYRSYYPHAGLVLPNTDAVAERVVVLPTGSSMHVDDIRAIWLRSYRRGFCSHHPQCSRPAPSPMRRVPATPRACPFRTSGRCSSTGPDTAVQLVASVQVLFGDDVRLEQSIPLEVRKGLEKYSRAVDTFSPAATASRSSVSSE